MSRPRKISGTVYPRKDSAFWWITYRNREGQVVQESTGTADRDQAERFLRERLDARDDGVLPTILASKNLTFGEFVDWFLEKRSKPPFRAEKTHLMHLNATQLLRPTFGNTRLLDIAPEAIEDYLRRRLSARRRYRTKLGIRHRATTVKPMTVHQEFRVLRRILNVAVKQKRLASNACSAVEFPVSVKNSTQKPHYMTASEQERIEMCAPSHLRHIIVIISEMGLRPYKELTPMMKSQVDLENSLVCIDDSKTPSGVGDMPMTELARQAFKEQLDETPGSEYLFPTPSRKSSRPYITTLKTTWAATLRRAGVPYFPIYHLRHTFATRLSAGGVSDHFVTLMLRQGDADAFKRYSQAKLNMMREALAKLDRQANEHEGSFVTVRPN
ncbi:MAG TPA: site-specific integrase [Terriglobia bacterium]|nr:site-specific integrase [Terriglobia bacterium]